MPIRDHLLNTLGATHLFMLDSANRDGGSGEVTAFTQNGTSIFTDPPICEGVANSFTSGVSNADIGTIGFVDDIVSADRYRKVTMGLWFSTGLSKEPTCIYMQGGNSNRKRPNNNGTGFYAGKAGTLIFAHGERDRQYMEVNSLFQLPENRPLFVTGIWEYHAEHAGSGNRLLMYVNGVLQGTHEVPTTSVLNVQTGDDLSPGQIAVGGSSVFIDGSSGDAILDSQPVSKRLNLLFLINDASLVGAEVRDLFERTVKPEITIAADTVANQQAALDALSDNSYSGNNCAIRIIQATDATDYRLFVDNITFEQDATTRDIAIQYVGPNTLTLENTNGSNAVEVSAPDEVDLDGTTILSGGGSISLVENVTRLNTLSDVSGLVTDKLVITVAGDYAISNSEIGAIENISGGDVRVSFAGTTVPSFIETDGSISVLTLVTISDLDGDSFKLIAWDADDILGGTVYDYADSTSHVVDLSGISNARIIVDKPGHYARVYEQAVSSFGSSFTVAMVRSPNVDTSIDISTLVAATTMSFDVDPYGAGFNVLRATLDIDASGITQDQWRRYHDYFSEDPIGLTLLGMEGLNGDEVYQTTSSGVAIQRPVLEVYAQGTRAISTEAYIDITSAVALFPPYDYSPRNADNVSVETATAEPLVNYSLIASIVANNQSFNEEDRGTLELAKDHARAANVQTKPLI